MYIYIYMFYGADAFAHGPQCNHGLSIPNNICMIQPPKNHQPLVQQVSQQKIIQVSSISLKMSVHEKSQHVRSAGVSCQGRPSYPSFDHGRPSHDPWRPCGLCAAPRGPRALPGAMQHGDGRNCAARASRDRGSGCIRSGCCWEGRGNRKICLGKWE